MASCGSTRLGWLAGWGSSSGQVVTLSPRYRVKEPDGERPYAARFSPDGSKIAVGYYDSAKVTIFSGKYLSDPVPALGFVDGSYMNAISWSSDGRFLYAAGNYQKQINGVWLQLIRRWSNGGRGAFIDIPASSSTVVDLAPLPDGSVAFGSGAPDFGVLSSKGKRTLFVPTANADFRNNDEGFLLALDGSKVRFGFEVFGKSPALFDLAIRQLTLDGSSAGLTAPLTTLPGVEVTEWENTEKPKLNGTPLKLNAYEISRSLALAPDGTSFVLGAEWHLRYFDKQGKELWPAPVPVPAAAWSVNIPVNGKVVVATFGDGTIRWYRLKDGKELLAFFPHADRKRWVLWTPSGYYDASVGGEDLIGWQVNRSKDKAADFFPASRFRDTYYRPDIVSRVLITLNEEEAVRQANAVHGIAKGAPPIKEILPPVIEIVDIPNGTLTATSKTITIRYKVRTPADAPANDVQAKVNARPIPTPKGTTAKVGENDIWEITVTIPEEDCEISLIAENKHSQSVPATVRVLWKGKLSAQKQLPRLLILAVGINNYDDNSLKKLDYAAKDAADFVAALEKQKGVLYSDIIARSLSTGRASLSDIKKDLEWLKKEATNKDIAVVFISGHGANDPPGSTSGIYHLVPSDGFVKELTVTSLEFSTLENVLGALPSKVLVFLDSCHSGGAYLNRNINELNEKGIVVFASSTGIQQSLEDNLWKNGAFTLALVEGLNGKADLMGDGEITISSLDTYISNRVGKLTGGKQIPVVTKKGIPDFSIARKKQ